MRGDLAIPNTTTTYTSGELEVGSNWDIPAQCLQSREELVRVRTGHSFSSNHPVQPPVEWSGGRENTREYKQIRSGTHSSLTSCQHLVCVDGLWRI